MFSRLFTQPIIQAQIIENIKAPPLCEEFTCDRWVPAQMASNAENVSFDAVIMPCNIFGYLPSDWLIINS